MAQKYVTIKDEQTIFDLSLQLYGTVEMVYKLIQDNPQISDIHFQGLQGLTVVYDEQNTDVTKYFSTNKKSLSTNYPIVLDARSFDDSFEISFL